MKVCTFSICGKFIRSGLCTAILSGVACQLFAGESSTVSPQRFSGWERVSDSELDRLRGGFVLANGVSVDFSLDRITSLNGAVVSSSFFQTPGNVSLFQNGELNQASELSRSAGLGSIIQNNLDNQSISTINSINITVSHLKNFDFNNSGMIFNNLMLPNIH
ncbi:hypothetical protein [Candidatus Methylobacter oryzae]|uniref:Filamentous hemagglutinin N-terminal domain-containing protein n=1 Tax=Candidatus Methylobacter oryzae TaxID=2497749 RepID=A0ABY3CCC7_9GAMM|nr:hypothetical protein [Candidatus Methylobacter oryzae]TRW95884.1 hypothetical protein EKO24_009340 [Candidatus Methylobacter oryzae]